MRFRLWLENRINREEAKMLVLNAIGAGDDVDEEDIGDILASPIKVHPDIEKNLTINEKLKTYASELSGFIRGNGDESLQKLVEKITDLAGPEHPAAAEPPGPAAEPTPLGSTPASPEEGEELGPEI